MLAVAERSALFWASPEFAWLTHEEVTAVRILTAAGMPPDDWQVRLLMDEARLRMAVAGRQSGKTTGCSAAILETPVTIPGSTTVVASRTLRQTARMLMRARRLYRRAEARGFVWPAKIINRDVTSIRFDNDSEVLALPGTADNVRGETVHRMVVEEAAFVPDDLFDAITPMMATTGGDIIAISSAYAEVGWFYSAWQNPESDWMKLLVRSDEISRIPTEFLARERKRMPAHVYAREYECVFQPSTSSVFRADDIAALAIDLALVSDL